MFAKHVKAMMGAILAIALSTTLGLAAGGSLQIKGSDTMVNLGQAWAEAFMKKNPGAMVAVTGGGSGVGIARIFFHVSFTQTLNEVDQSIRTLDYNHAFSRKLSTQRNQKHHNKREYESFHFLIPFFCEKLTLFFCDKFA